MPVMYYVKCIFTTLALCIFCMPSFATSELDKIQNQIKQTEQQNKQITIQLETSTKDVEQTKKKLVKAANQFSDLEYQRNALAQRIAELDAQRDKISQELSQSYDGISDSTAGMLFIASNPDFDSENMHDYILTSILLLNTVLAKNCIL